MSVKEQLARVRESLPEGVRLVAVSKTHPVEAIREAYDAGQRLFGESRPQELRAKYEVLPKDIEWHMIGHLQTNKVKYIAPFVSLVESVDSARLVEALQHEAAKCGRRLDILLEIHVADEETKSGWEPDELREYLSSEPFAAATALRRDFRRLKQLFDELRPRFGADFDTLSMGMSHDYRLAVACGSTQVRVGSLIFGERDYSKPFTL